ncbi:TAXI family TRAP transporter solute-binding subunit, partial [[Clostridium] symbiosum]
LLCVDENMDEELVYRITKILDESIPQLAASHESLSSLTQKGFICNELAVPLHKGAERYYLEKGYLDGQ